MTRPAILGVLLAAVGLLTAACATDTGGSPAASGGSPPRSAAASPPASSAAPPIQTGGSIGTLTPADDGTTVAMTMGQTAELVVADPAAPDPTVEGDAVVLVAIVNVAPSGQREWEIQAVRPGQSVIRGMADASYEIKLVVDP